MIYTIIRIFNPSMFYKTRFEPFDRNNQNFNVVLCLELFNSGCIDLK